MFSYIKRLYKWAGAQVHSPYADYLLGFLFYLEAICFVPTEPLLVLFCVERKDKAWYYAMIATLGAVLGGITSYLIGSVLWANYGESIIHNPRVGYLIKPETFTYILAQFQYYQWAALLAAGFMPVPFKATTFCAGFCQLSFVPFALCATVVRGSRYFLIAGVITLFGDSIRKSIDRYFNGMIILAMIIVGIVIFALKR